jgi:hypothetical protein
MAMAGWLARSPACEIATGAVKACSPSVESSRKACSWLRPARASVQVSRISLVAPVPVGAPLLTA